MIRKLTTAALSGVAVVALTGSASVASPSPHGSLAPPAAGVLAPLIQYNDWCGGNGFQLTNGEVYGDDFNQATWAASTVTNNWYLSLPNHNLVTAVNCTVSGEYTEISDGKRPNQCMTVSGSSPYQVYDLTCSAGKASQEWGVIPEGNICFPLGCNPLYALFNEYIQQKVPGCGSGNWTRVIYAATDSGSNAGLVMGCVDSNGYPNSREQWWVGQ